MADSADIIIEAENIKASNRVVYGDDRVYGIALENGGNITLRGNIDIEAYGGEGVQSVLSGIMAAAILLLLGLLMFWLMFRILIQQQ